MPPYWANGRFSLMLMWTPFRVEHKTPLCANAMQIRWNRLEILQLSICGISPPPPPPPPFLLLHFFFFFFFFFFSSALIVFPNGRKRNGKKRGGGLRRNDLKIVGAQKERKKKKGKKRKKKKRKKNVEFSPRWFNHPPLNISFLSNYLTWLN